MDCYNQSLNRCNKFAPKTKEEVAEMVKELMPVSEQRISENRNPFIDQLNKGKLKTDANQ
ncbi:hypothetical protein [Legionella longbeachae]|uniref:Uncharacterized protein n=1 Tax=Legionella longbeachae serogroup 1 (strain NSW150) TaxID=661367 RepID=D3HKU3_LEGLN|nr:hypothetical protein [Legionella longbeachae]HBD7397622.1 hypothetical protein [Legionella pneumophila]ARB93543.1 hypothetical protein A6J40_15775 [Legionella longbeachae]ARM33320.1 hypothetical protein B0B39_07200 [Legionella longbeachae]QIN33273.1 hypothetical protein GCB94_14540 [Legionella longbeachae]QIN36572.1 hypothetical protein GCS73_13535 [Legionella longbeachae]